jgi:hypothetical protein
LLRERDELTKENNAGKRGRQPFIAERAELEKVMQRLEEWYQEVDIIK